MQEKLQIHLFGPPQFTYQGKPITGFVSNKARALLIYLAVTGRTHSREALAELLWADTPITARASLRKVLSNLRRLAGVVLIEEGQQNVALDPASYATDVGKLRGVVHEDLSADAVDTLARTLASCQYDLLSGFPISLSYEFEAWALSQQIECKAQVIEGLERLAAIYLQQDALSQAIATVRRLLLLEPWREEMHRRLIGLLAMNNDFSAALEHFELCRTQLRAELDVDPSPATLALVAQIRSGEFSSTQPSNRGQSHHQARVPKERATRAAIPTQVATSVEFVLVGRSDEWLTAQTLWQRLEQPHFLCIGGEAGIGKTRLAEELLLLAERQNAPVARARSHELQGQLAYGPITDWLRTAPLRSALAKLDDVWLTELARLLPELLSDFPALPPPQPMQESWQRKRFFDALLQAFAQVAGPLLLLLDDLQWSDGETLDWLQYLVESTTQQVLVVGTVRSNEISTDHPLQRLRQQLQHQNRFTELPLVPLEEEATRQLANQVAERTVAGAQLAHLFRETAGNPLFVVESMRTAATAVAVESPPLQQSLRLLKPRREQQAMSTKMYLVIQARLAQLSPEAQRLAHFGATIGRAFDAPLLATTAGCSEEAVLLHLDELWQRRLIREVDATHFDFSHDRIRDVAYAEISPIKRRLLHRKVAHALEAIHGANLAPIFGHLAVHYEAAGYLEKAVTFHQAAADEARALYAHQRAITHRQWTLHLLRQLAPTRENRQHEIDLLLMLAKDRTNEHGLGYPLIHDDLRAANELVQLYGTPVQCFQVINALENYHRVRGEWHVAYELALQSVAIATEVDQPPLLELAHFGLASSLVRRGELESGRTYFEQIPDTLSTEPSGQNLKHLSRYAYSLWLLGFPDQALRQMDRSLQLRRQHEPEAVTIPLHHYSSIALFCGDLATVDRLSAELVAVATERHDDFSLRWGLIYRGWLLAQQGDLEAGIALMRNNADEHRARENYFYECVWRSLLAEVYILAADLDAALREIESTLAYADQSGDAHWNAQLLRLRGECLQAGNAPAAEVERHYQLALATARQQKARSLELRATISLCRLWQQHGKTMAAEQLLAEIYGWFTEGFDTADLVEAKALLTLLSCSFPSPTNQP